MRPRRSRSGRSAVAAAVFLLVISTTQAGIEADQSDFSHQVRSLYSFVPKSLRFEERTQKTRELDGFWARVKSDKAHYLPLLRTALDTPGFPAFFYFDGARLLLSSSSTHSDRTLALKAFPNSNLSEFNAGVYVKDVVRLGHAGLDTSEAAFRVLREPGFEASIPEHSLTVSQEEALVLMLLPIDEALYLSKAIDRLSDVETVEAQKSLLSLLFETVTDEGDRAIAGVATNERSQEEVRQYAEFILKAIAGLEQLSELPEDCRREIKRFVPSRASFSKVKAIRRKHVKVSDESLDELKHMTELLRILKREGR